MTDRLRPLLRDAAAAVPDYSDADRALRAARRGRRRRHATAAFAAVTAAVVAITAVAVLRPDRRLPDGTAPAPAPAGPAYPTVVTPPQQAPTLPSAGVGTAALLYAPCVRDCATFLVADSGRQYRLPTVTDGPPAAGYSLSPDGRWLAWPTGSGVRIRDLTGRTVHEVVADAAGTTSAWAWSADSRWVLLVRHTDGIAHHVTVFDVTTGTRHGRDPDQHPVAVTDDGQVIGWAGDHTGTGELSTMDPVSGASTRVTFDWRPAMRPDEIVTHGDLHMSPDPSVATVTLQASTATDILGPPSAVLLLDLDTGRVIRRLELPGPTRNSYWSPRTYGPEGITAVHSTTDRTEIVQIDPDTGTRLVRSTLPLDSTIVLRATRR